MLPGYTGTRSCLLDAQDPEVNAGQVARNGYAALFRGCWSRALIEQLQE